VKGSSALAAALTGRVPEYGYHLDRNRHGEIKILVTTSLKGATDYGTLGYFAGKVAEDTVPVFTGLPQSTSLDDFKTLELLLPLLEGGLYHALGLTPEAATEKAAFGGIKIGIPRRLSLEKENFKKRRHSFPKQRE